MNGCLDKIVDNIIIVDPDFIQDFGSEGKGSFVATIKRSFSQIKNVNFVISQSDINHSHQMYIAIERSLLNSVN